MSTQGKKHSLETKQRMADAQRLAWQREREAGIDRGAAISASKKGKSGKKHTLAARQEMAKARKAAWANLSPEARQRRSAAVSSGKQVGWARVPPEERQRKTMAMRNKRIKTHSQEAKQKISATSKAALAKLSKEERRLRTAPAVEASNASWARLSPEERRRRVMPGAIASRKSNPSGIERTVASLLDGLGIQYMPQHPVGHRYVVDFFVPSHMLVIECDGSYWHRDSVEKDANRDAWLVTRGYRILRLPETEIRSGDAVPRLVAALVE